MRQNWLTETSDLINLPGPQDTGFQDPSLERLSSDSTINTQHRKCFCCVPMMNTKEKDCKPKR
jgi:hypothetical protein